MGWHWNSLVVAVYKVPLALLPISKKHMHEVRKEMCRGWGHVRPSVAAESRPEKSRYSEAR